MARSDVADAPVQRIEVEERAGNDIARGGVEVDHREFGVGESDEQRVVVVGYETGCSLWRGRGSEGVLAQGERM